MPEYGLLKMLLLKLFMLLEEPGKTLLLGDHLGLMSGHFFVGLLLFSLDLLFDFLHLLGRYPDFFIVGIVFNFHGNR